MQNLTISSIFSDLGPRDLWVLDIDSTLVLTHKRNEAVLHAFAGEFQSEFPEFCTALAGAECKALEYGYLPALTRAGLDPSTAITSLTVGSAFPRHVLVVFGIASLLLAALYLLGQRDVKRLLAYSSVEHMGIIAIGLSFGVPLAATGVLLHVLAHAAAKGGAFMGAGAVMRAYRTKDLSRIRDAITVLPVVAPVFLLLVLGLCGLPPSGLFRSEVLVLAGGFGTAGGWVAGVLILLVTVAFVGLIVAVTRIVCLPSDDESQLPQRTRTPSMVSAMVLCLIGLTVLGVHPPDALVHLLDVASHQLVPA